MQPLSVTLLCALVVSAVQCLHLPAGTTSEIPRNSTPCSISDPGAVCSSIDVSENYSMQLDASRFHDSGQIEGEFLKFVLSVFVCK